MSKKKIFILLGHSDTNTFSSFLANEYGRGAEEAGHVVRRTSLGELTYDPILHHGYKEIQPLEPDLLKIQEDIKWADHLVVVYPNWWNTMPAILKGMFDRMWLPGFAFNFDKKTKKVVQHLKGKSARVIVVAGTYTSFTTWCKFGDFTNEVERGILGFSGFAPVKASVFGPCDNADEKHRKKWAKQVYNLGRKGI